MPFHNISRILLHHHPHHHPEYCCVLFHLKLLHHIHNHVFLSTALFLVLCFPPSSCTQHIEYIQSAHLETFKYHQRASKMMIQEHKTARTHSLSVMDKDPEEHDVDNTPVQLIPTINLFYTTDLIIKVWI